MNDGDVKDPTAIEVKPGVPVRVRCPDGATIQLDWTSDGLRISAATVGSWLANHLIVHPATSTSIIVRASMERGR